MAAILDFKMATLKMQKMLEIQLLGTNDHLCAIANYEFVHSNNICIHLSFYMLAAILFSSKWPP